MDAKVGCRLWRSGTEARGTAERQFRLSRAARYSRARDQKSLAPKYQARTRTRPNPGGLGYVSRYNMLNFPLVADHTECLVTDQPLPTHSQWLGFD
jgi:hypothetical protein